MAFLLPSLPYSYDALEPFFDEKTMRIHHTKHHQTYVDNTNFALSDLEEFSNLEIEELIKKLHTVSDQNKKNILRNNAGGHINHSIFWKTLKYGTVLKGPLKKEIEHSFDSIDNFKKEFEKASMNRFGSGWIWLVKQKNKLKIVSTANQDNPIMGIELSGTYGFPLFGLDVWEHAYYLKYQNKRLNYVQAFWNIINWDEISKRFSQDY